MNTKAIIDGDVLVYMSVWKSETLEDAKQKFREHVKSTCYNLFTDDWVMAIGGPDNFRVDLFEGYKGSRKKAKDDRPDWFLDLKLWAGNLENSIMTDNCEADDMVRIWANECTEAGIPRVVVSIDKDLHCIPGPHYNPRTKEVFHITPEYAERFYWQQVLTGDATDCIPGIYKCGPAKAQKILGDEGKPRAEYEAAVCRAYATEYGEEGHGYLLANAKLIHIMRSWNDYFSFSEAKYERCLTE